MLLDMLFERSLVCISLVALVALERFLPSVRLHMALQSRRRCASIVALVAFERLFSGVLSHYVNFQMSRLNA